MTYANPFTGDSSLVNQRVDMGVDFTGSGPIGAIGNGTVLETSGAGWPGGPFMSYRLNDGPAAGKVVYVAEQITPTVNPGDSVKVGDTIANMRGYIETGWADSSGTIPESQTSEAGSITGANLPAGGTEIGRNFESFLQQLGVGKANNLSASPGGVLPAGYPDWSQPGTMSGSAPSGSQGSAGTTSPSCLGVKLPVVGCLGIDLGNLGNDVIDWLERGSLIVLGAVLVLVGIWRLGGEQASENFVTSKAGSADSRSAHNASTG